MGIYRYLICGHEAIILQKKNTRRMKNEFAKSLRGEDWVATIMGLVLVSAVVATPGWIPGFSLQPLGMAWMFAVTCAISALGVKVMGGRVGGFVPAFAVIFAASVLSQWLAAVPAIKTTGLESVLFSVLIGLAVRNTVGLPKWLEPAVKSEYFIKIGIILLGTSVLFGEVMKAGALGMLQAVVVVVSVWYFTFWLAKRLRLDPETGTMLASAVSICGVSAAIATCGAIKGDSKKLSFVISIVLVVAIPMMYLMPVLAKWIGLPQEVAGAWLGGTIDTTGAVVASGKFVGETAETYSVIIKSSQNVLLGVAAFAISIYWSLRRTDGGLGERPTVGMIWDRFPKFVLGFVATSLLFSFLVPAADVKELGGLTKGLREAMFSIAFVCIGLETDFRTIFRRENARSITTFLVAQGVNIVITLAMAWLLFSSR
jgi:uncharacterized integral membrane protein (TIGR00698 family)